MPPNASPEKLCKRPTEGRGDSALTPHLKVPADVGMLVFAAVNVVFGRLIVYL